MAIMEAEDLDLLRNISAGDERSMKAFFAKYQRVVYAFALRRLGEAADAADVVNEVMLEVWNGASRFEGRSKVRTWILGIANFKAIDISRRRKHHSTEEFVDEFHAGEVADSLDLIVSEQHQVWIKRCIERLTAKHAQIVHLAFYEELSYTEIAEVVACPPGTVKTRMLHAKEKLKRCLQAIA